MIINLFLIISILFIFFYFNSKNTIENFDYQKKIMVELKKSPIEHNLTDKKWLPCMSYPKCNINHPLYKKKIQDYNSNIGETYLPLPVNYKNFYYEKKIDNLFLSKIKSNYLVPKIYYQEKFEDIPLNSINYLGNYSEIRHFLLKIINKDSNSKYKEISNTLIKIKKNKLCERYEFFIILNNLLPSISYQIYCVFLKDYSNIFIEKLLLSGMTINDVNPKFPKGFDNNLESNYISLKKLVNEKKNVKPINIIFSKNKNKNLLKKKKKQHEKMNYLGVYNGNCTTFDSTLLNHLPNKDSCNQDYLRQESLGINNNITRYYWDSPCKSDKDCPFYKKNKNYNNNRGGCINGICEMPLNVKRIRYKLYDKSEKNQPYCHNCINIFDNKCCDEQKNSKLYPNLKSPDYAFYNDTIFRKNFYIQYKKKE